jgi:hypothetical protein
MLIISRELAAPRGRSPCALSGTGRKVAPLSPEREKRALGLRIQLAAALARAARQVATHVGARRIHAAEEAARRRLDPQRAAVPVRHAHVGTMAVEMDQLIGAFGEASMIVAGHPHIRGEQGEATRATRQALGDDGQSQSVAELGPAEGSFRSKATEDGFSLPFARGGRPHGSLRVGCECRCRGREYPAGCDGAAGAPYCPPGAPGRRFSRPRAAPWRLRRGGS